MRMCRSGSRHVFVFVFAAIALTTAQATTQSSGGPYVLAAVVGGGGGISSGGTLRLGGTFGQPATATLMASRYGLQDGFWGRTASVSDRIFVNGFDH